MMRLPSSSFRVYASSSHLMIAEGQDEKTRSQNLKLPAWRSNARYLSNSCLEEQRFHGASPRTLSHASGSWGDNLVAGPRWPDFDWIHYRRIIHEHAPLRRADFQQSPALDYPPRRPAKLRRRIANGSGDAEKGMLKSLKRKLDTCSNAIESDSQKTWATCDI